MSEGVYVSGERRARKRRRITFLAVGLAAMLGAGGYATASWLRDRGPTLPGDSAALAPVESTEAPAPQTQPASLPPAPSVGIGPGTKAAQRRFSTPSPIPAPSPAPSPSTMADEQIAAAQVNRLLQHEPAGSGVDAAAVSPQVTVRTEITPDGASVRVLSARWDITRHWRELSAADEGEVVDGARCTRNIRTDQRPGGQQRPGLMLCWRTSTAKSVVAVATGTPQSVYTAAVVAREWVALG